MSSVEEIELDKHRGALEKDVEKLIDKYLKEIEWSVPDVDESHARQLIVDEIERTLRRGGGSSLSA